jgi:hypothetical protein
MNVCGKDIVIQGKLVRIARLDEDTYEFPKNPETVAAALRKCGTRIDLFTFMQILPESQPKFSYPMEWGNLAVLPISTFEHWWKCQISSFPRNRARQAEKKGVTIREALLDDALVRGIWEVYNECPVRQGKPFEHYGKDLETVRSELATFPESSIFIGAYIGDKLIGFIKMTYDETLTQANMMNIVSMMSHRDKAPTNALIAQAVRSCAERGIKNLVYQSFSYGKKQGDSLSNFKEINGFKRVDLPRYYIPLTALGWAAFRLGLHKKFADRIPESVLTKLRELRNAWYRRKQQSAAQLS